MSDPLSVAASVIGIISVAAKVSTGLVGVLKKAHNAPSECRQLQLEVDNVQAILRQLQQFLLGTRKAPRSRTSLILVDQVITTLAACVATFSELDTFTEALQSESDLKILDRLRWVSKESELKEILVRIESHKSSLNLMLTILTCQKQEEAEDQVDHLCRLVEMVLESNTILAQRLGALEATPPDASDRTLLGTVAIQAPRISQDLGNDEVDEPHVSRSGTWTRNKRGFAFEELLMNSRAYRNVSLDNSDAFSIVSAAGRTGSWSMLSGLSLSETSHIGILAIPIYEIDISNRGEYDFTPPAVEPSSLALDSGTVSKHANKTSRRRWIADLLLPERFQRQTIQIDHEIEQPSPIFGISIRQSITYANVRITLKNEQGASYAWGYVPVIVAAVGVFIKEQGLDVEDIFALSGNPARLMQLQTAFETPPRYGNPFRWDGYTVHDSAALLQRYLKTLPEPIVPYAMYDDFISISGSHPEATGDDLNKTISIAQNLMKALPPLNCQLLIYILDMLAVFNAHSAINKMNLERLVAAFHPAILSCPPEKMDAEAHSISARVVIFLVKHQDYFFEVKWGKDTISEKPEIS
ncbi:Rho GTPase activation protein [Xylaria arbuscula]|nr:Rho GTPase activation protein [Xylaria arbuscula]